TQSSKQALTTSLDEVVPVGQEIPVFVELDGPDHGILQPAVREPDGRHPGLLIEDPRPAHVPAHYLAEVGRQLKDNLVGPVPRTAGQSRNRLLQLEKALRRVV